MSRRGALSALRILTVVAGVVLAEPSWPAPAPEAPSPEATPAAAESRAAADAADRKSTWLLGHARTGRRRWVVGAAVLATPVSGESRIWVTTTDEKGAYRFESIPEGVYDVTLTKYGLAPVKKERIELRFPFRAVVEVVMVAGPGMSASQEIADPGAAPGTDARLEGHVHGRTGKPIGEVRIRLIRADGSADPRYAMTGQDGRFAISALSAGRWRLEILGAGFLPVRVPVNLEGEGTVTAVLVEQPASYVPQPLDLMPPEMPVPPAVASSDRTFSAPPR